MMRRDRVWTTAAVTVTAALTACGPGGGTGSAAEAPSRPDVQVTPEAPPAPDELPVAPDVDALTAVLRVATSYVAERAPRDTLYLSPAWRSGDRIDPERVRGVVARKYSKPALVAESLDLHYGFGGALVEFDDLELYENSARLTTSFATVRDWDNAHWTMYRIRLHRFAGRWRVVDRISTSYAHGQLLMESDGGFREFSRRKTDAAAAAARHLVRELPGEPRLLWERVGASEGVLELPIAEAIGADTMGIDRGIECARGDCPVRVEGLVIHLFDVEFTGWRRAGALVGWRINREPGPPGPAAEKARIRLREDSEEGWIVLEPPLDPGE